METQRNPNEPIKPTATGQEGGQQGGGTKNAIAIRSVIVTNKAVAASTSAVNKAGGSQQKSGSQVRGQQGGGQ